jgi:predicted GIY-YIG superfamily endonuclease
MYYAYILKLSNNKYYVGSTSNLSNLKNRMKKHEKGSVPSTSKYSPQELVWYSAFKNKEKALQFEKYLKTASGKVFRNKRLI